MHVLFSAPLQVRTSSPLTKALDEKLFALQLSYPDTIIVRDPLTADTSARVAKLQELSARWPRKMSAIVADKSFNVRDGKLLQNIASELRSDGVDVTTFTRDAVPLIDKQGGVVIAISGHTSTELAVFVRSLGNRSFLKDNIVIFMSCESPSLGSFRARSCRSSAPLRRLRSRAAERQDTRERHKAPSPTHRRDCKRDWAATASTNARR
jgi:hypothetical protein